jgi:hypothetical protein
MPVRPLRWVDYRPVFASICIVDEARGALWDPTHHRWCILPNRISQVLEQLERFQRAGVRLD